jgi:hypothetical protein
LRTSPATSISLPSSPRRRSNAPTCHISPPPSISLCAQSQPKVRRGIEPPGPPLRFALLPGAAVPRCAGKVKGSMQVA